MRTVDVDGLDRVTVSGDDARMATLKAWLLDPTFTEADTIARVSEDALSIDPFKQRPHLPFALEAVALPTP